MEQQNHTAESIMELVKRLPTVERERLQRLLADMPGGKSDLEEYLAEHRFAGGRVCPICGGTHVRRNGHRKNGAQKFVCVDCGKSFSITKNTVFSGTHKSLSVWKEYMDCMAEGLSLDKSAERCGITHGTSFTWRHKILDAIGKGSENDNLTGIVEADETFLPVSYKGDKTAFEQETAGRAARRRGGENHKRGLSDELVCVPCAVDRKGGALSNVAKLGKCSAEAVEKVLGGRVPKESTLCTDKETSYRKFSKKNGNDLVQIKGGKGSVKGIYHIQHLNSYHSKLKSFLNSFNGVSSKYLNNYLTWNNTVEHRPGSLAEKARKLLEKVTSVLFEETCLNVPQRPPLPLLVKIQS